MALRKAHASVGHLRHRKQKLAVWPLAPSETGEPSPDCTIVHEPDERIAEYERWGTRYGWHHIIYLNFIGTSKS